MKEKRTKRWLPVVVCYLLALVIWLGYGVFGLVRSNLRAQNGQISPRQFVLDDAAVYGGFRMINGWEEHHRFLTTDPDPQWTVEFPEGQAVNNFVFKGYPITRGAGEMVLYYTVKPGQGISERRKLWAARDENGDWVFDLGGRTVYSLRWDAGTVAGVVFQWEGLEMNRPVHWTHWFMPGARDVFVLLFAPLAAWALVAEGVAFVRPILTRRRFERRYQG